MSTNLRNLALFGAMAALLVWVGLGQSWSVSLTIINMCLISGIMALGVNIQWGYAGLFNVGTMGFAALGGIAAVLVAKAPVTAAWQAGGVGLVLSFVIVVLVVVLVNYLRRRLLGSVWRGFVIAATVVIGFVVYRAVFDPAVEAIEAVNPAKTGYLGGLGMPIILSWMAGGVFAAGAAWLIGKIALGLRSDYLAIATLGISEIVIAVLKNEDWLVRGVKNVTGLPRPVPYEVNLQIDPWFIDWVRWFNQDVLLSLADAERARALQAFVVDASGVFVKLCYAGLFLFVALLILWLSERALRSPWGRMMRAIRDNEDAAGAMGKDVTRRHLQVFIIGSAVVGIAGAMMTTLDGQFTPGTYNPLRFTFLIWVMVIIGGSGNNFGSILGGFLVWFVWVEAEPAGQWLMTWVTSGMAESSGLRHSLLESAPHMRQILMGLLLLTVMRFSPRGLIPEVVRR